VQKTFKASFEKVAFNPKALLNTIPKATQRLGIVDKPGKIIGSLAHPAQKATKEVAESAASKAVKTPPPKAPMPNVPPRTPLSSKAKPNSHAEYLRSIGAIGKTSKNEGMVLKYSPSGTGGGTARKSQFESISPVGKPPVGPDRGPLK
jgi:hypothetical protein